MELSLSKLISSIGESVQEARYAIEERAVGLYFKGGYEEKGDRLTPITKAVSLPKTLDSRSGKKDLDIPLTALFSHKTMSLNKVDVDLRLKLCEQDGEMLFKITNEASGSEEDSGQCVDLSLSFGLDDTPEGMARLNQENVKLL